MPYGSINVAKPLTGPAAFTLWRYLDGVWSDGEPVTYGGQSRGTVSVVVYNGQIQSITLSDSALQNTCAATIESIIENNGVVSAALFSGLDAAVAHAVTDVLSRHRITVTTDGVGSSSMLLTIPEALRSGGALQQFPEGNYKLVARLIVSQVCVAEDFFIFNINRSTILPDIQEGNAARSGTAASNSGN